MGTSSRYSAPQVANAPFIPVSIRSIRLDSRPPVDLYIETGSGDGPVLYAARDTVFTESHLRRIEENRVDTLLIRSEDSKPFRQYLELRLPDVLVDSGVSTDEKARIVHYTSQGLVADLLEDPTVDKGFQRSSAVIENTVDFLFSDPGAVRHMIETAAYDFNTFAHSVGTMVYATSLAFRLGLRSGDAITEFGQAAFLRDIGLSQLPRSSWDGEGALSLAQFDAYKRHPILSEQILRDAGRFSSNALDLVRHHHERLSGTGFPDGIGGRELSTHLRILNIAEAFDSLTLSRSYRQRHSTYQALKLMSTDMYNDYDQDILKAFIELMGNPD